MSTPHRATEEQWEIVEICREQGHTPWPTATCLLELRSRVENLERRCEVQLQQLSDLQGRHHRLVGSVRLLEREVVTDGPQPEPLTNVTGKGVIVEGQFDYSGTTYVYRAKAQPAPAAQPEPPTLQEAQANKVHHEAELAGLEAWRRQHLIQTREVVAGQPAPAVKESLTTAPAPQVRYSYCPVTIAECGGPCEQGPEHCDCGEIKPEPVPPPAGSLVEQMLDAMDQHLESNRYAEARAALRVVAAWLRGESDGHLGSGAHWARCMEQEANR
jgi:hypothetical protein